MMKIVNNFKLTWKRLLDSIYSDGLFLLVLLSHQVYRFIRHSKTLLLPYFHLMNTKIVVFLLSSKLFFVLRKKHNQISLLHLFHHTIMPISCWLYVRFAPLGQLMFSGFINTFVHIIMYFYYMLRAMGPRYAYIIKWKKYVTAIQMVQKVFKDWFA